MRQTTDLDFLLSRLATRGMPKCPECGVPMTIAVLEAREDSPDYSTLRCPACQRSDRLVIEHPSKMTDLSLGLADGRSYFGRALIASGSHPEGPP